MECVRSMLILASLLICYSSSIGLVVSAQGIARPPSTSPAPAPVPEYVNLTDLFSLAGPFHTFLNYLQSTKVLETFQNQANNTDEGITIFVPKDPAFAKLKNKKPSLSNLTSAQLKSVCLFHALPHYYALADFRNLSQFSPINTFAGGQLFGLNFSDVSGTVHLSTGWTSTKISSAVHATNPVAVYQVDSVLLPEAIFGTDIPPIPAPAPAPAADAPLGDDGNNSGSPASSPPSSSPKITSSGLLNRLILAIASGSAFLLL